MSLPDPTDELRAARPTAPPELRARVRAVAATSAVPPSRTLTWRRASFALVPAVGVLVIAAIVLGGRDGADRTTAEQGAPAVDVATVATSTVPGVVRSPPPFARAHVVHGSAATSDQAKVGVAAAPAPPRGRVVRYSTYLELQLRTPDAVARAAQRALRTARALGGFPSSVQVDARGRTGSADLVLRIPRAHVQAAVERLSALGTIVGEHVSIQDLQAGLNATDRTIARLQGHLRDLRALPQTDATRRAIASTTTRIERLQRASGSTVRGAHFATVDLQLHTRRAVHPRPHHASHGPLHGLGVAFHWIWIGLVYALALGAPMLALLALGWLAARTIRRRGEERLLGSRP